MSQQQDAPQMTSSLVNTPVAPSTTISEQQINSITSTPNVSFESNLFANLPNHDPSLKRTCCSFNDTTVAFGTEQGHIYFHDRYTLELKLTITHQELGQKRNFTLPITKVSLTPNLITNDKRRAFIGAVDSAFIVYIFEIELTVQQIGNASVCFPKVARLLNSHSQHKSEISCIAWANDFLKLFTGDISGFVFEFKNQKKSLLSIGSSTQILKEDGGGIVQLSISGDHLLISSTKRSIDVNLSAQQYKGIGTKPRDGIFGACFQYALKKKEENSVSTQDQYTIYAFSARPGRRIWCSDISTCKVLSTLKFPSVAQVKDLKFTNLLSVGPYLASYNEETVTILDIVKLKILDVKYGIGTIKHASSFGFSMFIVHVDENSNHIVSRIDLQLPENEKQFFINQIRPKINKPIANNPQQVPSQQAVQPSQAQPQQIQQPVQQPAQKKDETPLQLITGLLKRNDTPPVPLVKTPSNPILINSQTSSSSGASTPTTPASISTPKAEPEIVATTPKEEKLLDFENVKVVSTPPPKSSTFSFSLPSVQIKDKFSDLTSEMMKKAASVLPKQDKEQTTTKEDIKPTTEEPKPPQKDESWSAPMVIQPKKVKKKKKKPERLISFDGSIAEPTLLIEDKKPKKTSSKRRTKSKDFDQLSQVSDDTSKTGSLGSDNEDSDNTEDTITSSSSLVDPSPIAENLPTSVTEGDKSPSTPLEKVEETTPEQNVEIPESTEATPEIVDPVEETKSNEEVFPSDETNLGSPVETTPEQNVETPESTEATPEIVVPVQVEEIKEPIQQATEIKEEPADETPVQSQLNEDQLTTQVSPIEPINETIEEIESISEQEKQELEKKQEEEKRELQRIEDENKKAEQERIRIEEEKRKEQERIEEEKRKEKERIAEEKRKEKERIADEKRKKEEEEQRRIAEEIRKKEVERLEQEKKRKEEEERQRIEEEKRKEQERLEEERKRKEQERIEEEKRKEQERIEEEKRKRQELIQKKHDSFFELIVEPIESLFEQLANFLSVGDGIWCPKFTSALQTWFDEFVKLVEAEQEEKHDYCIISEIISKELNEEQQSQLSKLLNFRFERLFAEENVEKTYISHALSILHEFLFMSQCCTLCNSHNCAECIITIFEIEDQHKYLAEERKNIDRLFEQFKIKNSMEIRDQIFKEIDSLKNDYPSVPLRYTQPLSKLPGGHELCALLYPYIQVWNYTNAIGSDNSKYIQYLTSIYKLNHSSHINHQFMEHFITKLIANYEKSIHESLIISVIDEAKGNLNCFSEPHFLEKELKKNPSAQQCLYYFYEKFDKISELIELIVRGDNLNNLAIFMEKHYENQQNWISLMNCIESTPKSICTKEQAVFLMCKCLGSLQTLNILQDSSVESCLHDVDPIIYTKICQLARAETEQSKLRHNMIEIMDSYMWSEKDECVAPQIRSILSFQTDIPPSLFSSINTPEESFLYISSFYKLDNSKSSVNEFQTELPRFTEDCGSNWGSQIRVGKTARCFCCRLPLTERVGGDVLVFPCGHCYHRSCNPLEVCTHNGCRDV